MAHDDSGKDILRKHIESIIDETIAEVPEGKSYADMLDVYATAIIDGLGLTPTFVAEGHVVISGAFSRGAK